MNTNEKSGAASNRPTLLESWKREESAFFQGWDFSHLNRRMLNESPPWDYLATARSKVAGARNILDMATGGGEVLSSLGPFKAKVTAMEGYAPNVAVAKKRLEPLGVCVVACGDAEPFPFDDFNFDLVLNRHGGLWNPEVGRVTKPGGFLVTQQVGPFMTELKEMFGASNPWEANSLELVSAKLVAQNFEILEAQNWVGTNHFLDVGALVYSMKRLTWVFPDFSVEKHQDLLFKLQERLERDGKLKVDGGSFWIVAQKKK